MSEDKRPVNTTQEIKLFIKGFTEALDAIRTLLVALIAFVITVIERLLETIETRKSISKAPQGKTTAPTPIPPRQMKTIVDLPKKKPQQVQPIVSQDIRQDSTRSIVYPLLAVISTFTLVGGVIRLGPISKWAHMQNECIESTYALDESLKDDIRYKIMTCNGGHN